MVQLNLLPDVKMEYIRAERRKRVVIGTSVLVAGGFLVLMILLFLFVRVGQKQHMSAVDKDIDAAVAQLQQNPDLDKVLTIQNQLASLPTLHNDKKITSRTFDYLRQMTPNKATISNVTLDFEANVLNIKGNADSLSTVNKFADTLKFTTYKLEGDAPAEGNAFTNVVLKSFAVGEKGAAAATSSGAAGDVTYELEMNFDLNIYTNSSPSTDGKSPVKLTVPNIISTRSATQTPSNLFAPQPETEGAP